MQLWYEVRCRTLQLQLQQLAEELVIPVLLPVVIELNEELVRALQHHQQICRIRPACDCVAQRHRKRLKD